MGRVLIRDQYSAEHWVDEGQLAFAPWRDCVVVERESAGDEVPAAEPARAPEPQGDDKAAKRKTPAAE